MRSAYRSIYRLILRMHPADFRNEFEREMLLDFEQALVAFGFARLFFDALQSLALQWAASTLRSSAELTGTPTHPLLAGHYSQIEDPPMSLLEFVRGLIASAILVALCFFALNASTGAKPPLLSVAYAASASPARLHSPTLHSQLLHPTSPLPKFEVATVRLHQPSPTPPPAPDTARPAGPPAKIAPDKPGGISSDRVQSIMPVRMFIAFAYNIPFGSEDTRVLGGPGWVGTDPYEIQAKIEESQYAAMQKMNAQQQREDVDLMEQSLLAERFNLKLHIETRQMAGFKLTTAGSGTKLTPAKDGELTRISMSGNTLTATNVTLDDLIQSPFLNGRTIVNDTGLKGRYDFTLTWNSKPLTTTANPDNADDAPDLRAAVQQQLGLKLMPAKVPVEVIVIDHIDRPSSN